MQLAARATAAQRSYSFIADERIAAGTVVQTHLSGRLVRGRGLAYTLTVGNRRTQVVRLPHATFLRTVPGRWSRLTKPRKLVNPTATLLGVLRGMTATGVITRSGARVVSGQLAAADAGVAGLPQLSAPAHVVVVVARAGDVVGVQLRAQTAVNGHPVAISIRTRYASFGHVAAIRRPA